jgi:hypothetical protein
VHVELAICSYRARLLGSHREEIRRISELRTLSPPERVLGFARVCGIDEVRHEPATFRYFEELLAVRVARIVDAPRRGTERQGPILPSGTRHERLKNGAAAASAEGAIHAAL